MSGSGRYVIWCPGAALLGFVTMVVAAPSFMAPLIDSAVDIGGLPAGLVVTAAFWLALSVVGLVAIRLTHRTDARLGVVVGLVVVAAILLLLEPTVILIIKNVAI